MSNQELTINNLIYTIPANSTLAVSRNDQKNYFDQRNYSAGQTIRCVFQTGSKYVNPFDSQLVFTAAVSSEAGASASWAKGSSLNCIKNVRVYHKNGSELVNIQNHNVNQLIEDKAGKSKSYFDTVGNLAGYDATNSASGMGTGSSAWRADLLVGGQTEVQIPLSQVAPIFNPEKKLLMPNVLASGLILEIDLATSAECMVRTGGAADVELTIKDIYLNLSCTSLSDMAMGSLNDIASEKLLEYSYIDTYTSRITQNANNSVISTSINKAVAQADHITVVEIDQANLNDQTADEFSFSSDNVSYQFTVGSRQLPSLVFIDGERQGYAQLLKTYNKYNGSNEYAALGYFNYNAYVNIKSTSFSKDQMLAMASLPINSSRSLRYEQKYNGAAPSQPRTIYIFLHYLKVLSLSLSDVKVDL
jgi:hypothetical protein